MGMFRLNQRSIKDKSKERIILHIDFDSFFASVEQQHDPSLRNRPMGVTATNGRTCIIASSREAKSLGIGTGSRSFDAFKICPDLKLVPADFKKYLDISKKFLNICKDYSPTVELFSIDEVFIDVTPTVHLFQNDPYYLISQIKTRIKNEIGEYITASVGISYNKMMAKMASGLKKPNGIFEIKKEKLDEVYKSAELLNICGIGERIKDRLNKIGVFSLLKLRRISFHDLVREFGNEEAKFLRSVAWGVDDSEVVPYTQIQEVKSVGRNYCLPKNEYDKRKVLQNVYELFEELCIKLRRLNKKSRTLGFYLRGNIEIHGRKTYTFYFDDSQEIFNLFKSMLRDEWSTFNKKSSYIRQISVWVSSLEDNNNLTMSLFEEEKTKKDRITNVIDKINDRFGDHTIRNGFLLYADRLTTMPNGYMADRYERIKISNEALEDLGNNAR
jgi:DNA polymerase-4